MGLNDQAHLCMCLRIPSWTTEAAGKGETWEAREAMFVAAPPAAEMTRWSRWYEMNGGGGVLLRLSSLPTLLGSRGAGPERAALEAEYACWHLAHCTGIALSHVA